MDVKRAKEAFQELCKSKTQVDNAYADLWDAESREDVVEAKEALKQAIGYYVDSNDVPLLLNAAMSLRAQEKNSAIKR